MSNQSTIALVKRKMSFKYKCCNSKFSGRQKFKLIVNFYTMDLIVLLQLFDACGLLNFDNYNPKSQTMVTSSLVCGSCSPAVKVSSGCSTICWARRRCTSAAWAGRSRESSRRPRTTRPSGNTLEVSFRGSPTPRTSSYSSRRWSWEEEEEKWFHCLHLAFKRAARETGKDLTMISREPLKMLPPPWERSVTTVSWSTSSCTHTSGFRLVRVANLRASFAEEGFETCLYIRSRVDRVVVSSNRLRLPQMPSGTEICPVETKQKVSRFWI